MQAVRLGAAGYLTKDPGYLNKLPGELENAYYRVELLREKSALRESEERLRLAVEVGRMGAWDWNRHTDVLTWSKEVYEIMGVEPVREATYETWAKLVHPELSEEEAYDKLWDEITHICRLDTDDPEAAWRDRAQTLLRAAARLTERRFDAIRLHGPGTDLTVGLLPTSVWHAADFETVDGIRHFPNIPSEEIFTTPDPLRADGHVTATRPLELYGALIDGIRVEFVDGRAVRIDAERGADAMRGIAAKDDGGTRLGELALVDGDGRIGPLGTVFYETLIDENAASHIALGSGYTLGVESDEDRARVNVSEIHVDFMIGSPELDVDGITRDGDVVPFLRSGAWQV